MSDKLDFLNKITLSNQVRNFIMDRLTRIETVENKKSWRIYKSIPSGMFLVVVCGTDNKGNKITKISDCYMGREIQYAEIPGHELCDLLVNRDAIFKQMDAEEHQKSQIKQQLVEIILDPDTEYRLKGRDDKTKHFNLYRTTQEYKINIDILKIYDEILEKYTHTNVTFDKVYYNGNSHGLIGPIIYNDFDLIKAIQTRHQNDLAKKNKIEYTSKYFDGVKNFLAEFQKTKKEVKGK